MIGVQSCKHFGCQRSQPTILGFGHPSGALEDGARGTILIKGTIFTCRVLKQWNLTLEVNYWKSFGMLPKKIV